MTASGVDGADAADGADGPDGADEMVRFPGSSRIVVHRDAGRTGRSVRTLAGASDWRRDLADRAGGAIVGVLGTQLLPTAGNGWVWPPVSPATLATELRRAMPGLRIIGAVIPRQPDRRRLSVLCRYAGNRVVVKLGVDEPGASMATEAHVLELLTDRPLPGIETPAVVATGIVEIAGERCPYLATSTIGLGAQRPARDAPLRTFESDLTDRLASLAGASDGAVAVHGDLTPWNLRRTHRGLALFDWESAGWGAPGSDLEHYRLACAAVRPWWSRKPQ